MNILGSYVGSLMFDVMKAFSSGPPVYLRVTTETGGNTSLHVPGVVSSLDYPLPHVPKIRRLTVDRALADGTSIQAGSFEILFFFGGEATEALFDQAAGVVIGGSYDSAQHKVTGGRYYAKVRGTVVKLCQEATGSCGAEFIVEYSGK